MNSHDTKGFTLIELIIVVAILGILAASVVIVLNPVELLAQSRDAQRLSDIDTLNKTLALYQENNNGSLPGSADVLYISVADSSSTCGDLGMPTLPSGWSYQCSNTPKSVGGSGWIPANFSTDDANTISSLPVDPVNSTSSGLYYTYSISGNQYEVTAITESQKFRSKEETEPDVQDYPGVVAEGTSLSISPLFNPSGLVGYWPFNEGTGTTTYDYSGNSNNGTIGGTLGWTSGKISYGLLFDGSTTQVSATPSFSGALSSFSVSLWMDPTVANGNRNIFFNLDGQSLYPRLYFGSAGNVELQLRTNNVSQDYLGNHDFLDGTWANLIVTFDGTTNISNMYVNGALDATYTFATGTLTTGSSTTFLIGHDTNLSTYFDGVMDEFRVYNRAYSPAEVQALYNSEK